MKLFDKLNTPLALVTVLVLFLLVDGVLSYRYWLTTETNTASAPSLNPVLAANKEDDSPSEEEEPAVIEGDDKAERPNGEEQGALEAEEREPTPLLTPYPPTPAQSADQPAPVTAESAAENAAVLPAPEPTPAYPEPVYEEERSSYDYTF